MRSGSRCPAFYGEIPPMRWGILDDDGGYFYCITYTNDDSAIINRHVYREIIDSMRKMGTVIKPIDLIGDEGEADG